MGSLFSYIIFVIIVAGIIYYWIRFILNKIDISSLKELEWIDCKFAIAETIAGFRSIVTGKFYFEPDGRFYSQIQEGDKAIQNCTSQLAEYIGYSGHPLSVNFSELDIGHPAKISGSNIVIQSKYRHNHYAVGAILAHEVTHAYLSFNSKWSDNEKDTELMTDCVAICLGLGKLILNGLETLKYEIPGFPGRTIIVSEKSYYGYFSYKSLLYAYEKDRKLKHIKKREALRNIRFQLRYSLFIQNIIINIRSRLYSLKAGNIRKAKKDSKTRRPEKTYFNCINCGRVEHKLRSKYLGVEQWECTSCGKMISIERF
jgi:hypothetical protein